MSREIAIGVSVIVVTYGRAQSLERCLRSLLEAGARCPGLRLSIRTGINGLDPETERVLAAFRAGNRPLRLSVQTFDQRQTPGRIRNHLLDGHDDDWFFFVDDDAFIEPDHFERFLEAHHHFLEAAVIGGPNITPAYSGQFQRASGLALACRLATGRAHARYRRQGEVRPCGEESLILCNLFVRASVLGCNPFHEAFFCNEENWLLQELSDRGIRMIHDPGLFVWHERRSTFRQLALQIFRYGVGRGLQARLRPNTVRPTYLIPSICFLFGIGSLLQWLAFSRVNPVFGICGGLYFALCAGGAWLGGRRVREEIGVVLTMALCFPLIHSAYGVGFIMGAFRGQAANPVWQQNDLLFIKE